MVTYKSKEENNVSDLFLSFILETYKGDRISKFLKMYMYFTLKIDYKKAVLISYYTDSDPILHVLNLVQNRERERTSYILVSLLSWF